MKYYKDSKEFPLFNYIRIVDTKDFFYVIKGYDGEAIEGADIKECEENAIRTFVSEYSKMCEIYSGWLKNGKVFILDKRDKFILALYKVDDISHSAIVNYNPLNVDCIEQSVSNNQFFKELENRFEISADEEMLIKECDELVKMTIDRVR